MISRYVCDMKRSRDVLDDAIDDVGGELWGSMDHVAQDTWQLAFSQLAGMYACMHRNFLVVR